MLTSLSGIQGCSPTIAVAAWMGVSSCSVRKDLVGNSAPYRVDGKCLV